MPSVRSSRLDVDNTDTLKKEKNIFEKNTRNAREGKTGKYILFIVDKMKRTNI